MSPPPPRQPNPSTVPPLKEIRCMPLTLNRFLDAAGSLAIVFLTLFVSAAAFGLGA
jgi:hypothetical protein